VAGWITTLAAGQTRQVTGQGQGTQSTEGPGANAEAISKNTKRPRSEAKQTQYQNQPHQAMSNTEYTKMPAGTTAQCPDVGFQSQKEVKPYAHSLRTLLQNENKCLVCWSPDHGMYSCPDSSIAMKADMERKPFVSSHAGSLVKTKLKQDSKRRCLKADFHVVANASMHINRDSLASCGKQ